MGSRTHTSRGHYRSSGDRGSPRPLETNDEWYHASGFQQGKNITGGRRSNSTRGGGSTWVSPGGGEYLRGGPREYTSEAYPDQGFGKKVRARPDWRMEDKIFGADGLVEQARQHAGVGPRGYRRSDERIREDACEALSEDPYLDASNIEVTVEDGELTLSGSVTSRAEKRRAEDLVDAVRGVRDVHNRIEILSVP